MVASEVHLPHMEPVCREFLVKVAMVVPAVDLVAVVATTVAEAPVVVAGAVAPVLSRLLQ